MHILNLDSLPASPIEDPPQGQEEDQYTRTQNLIEETRSDVRRVRMQLDRQNDDYESQQQRTKVLSMVLGLLVVCLLAALWFAYPTFRDQKKAIADMLGLQTVAKGLGGRVDSLQANYDKIVAGLPGLSNRMDQLQAAMKTNIEAARRQAQAAAAQMGERIRADVNRTMNVIQARLAGVESNQKEASERVTQLQEQVDGLKQEIAAMRQAATAPVLPPTEKTEQLKDAQRVEFQASKRKSVQITPEVRFTVTTIDTDRQQVDAMLEVGGDSKTMMMVRGTPVRYPVTFNLTDAGRTAELVVTEVSTDAVTGYLVIPAESKSVSQQ